MHCAKATPDPGFEPVVAPELPDEPQAATASATPIATNVPATYSRTIAPL